MIDLHLHTNYSDGSATPAEAVALARQRELTAISITDHDTFAAVDEALSLADENLEIITGIELSCMHESFDIHMLAYFVDHHFPPLAEKVTFFSDERLKRGRAIVAKLNEIGIDLRLDTVMNLSEQGTVGRLHVADALVKEEFVHTVDEAFNRYLGYHAPAYVAKAHFDPEEAIKLVHEAGGIAVMAHPGTVRHDEVIPGLVDMGLDGIEVHHAKHTPAIVRHYKKIAAKHGLTVTGGSDWHGRNDHRSEIGSQKVPDSILHDMREYLAKRQSSL